MSHQWADLVACHLTQAEICQPNLHRIDDGEAAVHALMWDHHGEAALWALRHDVTGFFTQTHTHRQEERFQISTSSTSPGKLTLDKLDIVKGEETQLGLDVDIQVQV